MTNIFILTTTDVILYRISLHAKLVTVNWINVHLQTRLAL